MADESYEPIFLFDTDDPEFSRGFEAGRLWEMLKTGEAVEQDIHAQNAEMVLRMCESLERTVIKAEIVNDDWMLLIVESE